MMKLAFTILSFISVSAKATTYYISNAGSDANNGTSSGTSWQTISKVNGFTFLSGDSILFKRGDSWNEQFIVPRTNLYFGAYGIGIKPLITGFQTQTGFTQAGNVWSKTLTTVPATGVLRCVLLNGSFAFKSRTPNTGYSTYTGSTGDSVIVTSQTGTPSLVGKEIAVRSITWVIDVVKITAQSGGTLTVYPKLYTSNHGFANGYFLLNDSTYIDSAGEYSYDSVTKRLSVYSTSTPTVQTSIFDTLVKCRKGTTFDNISFTGANQLIIQTDTLTTLKNCLFRYAGWDAIEGHAQGYLTVDSDSIMNIFNNGITYDWFAIRGEKLTVTNNYFKNIGYVPGMGKNGDGAYIGMLFFPDTALVEYNGFDSIGYNVIHFEKYPTVIAHNHINHFCMTKCDCAGIYTFSGASGNIIDSNIVENGIGTPDGVTGNNIANPLYIDDFSGNQIVYGNTFMFSTWGAGFQNNNSSGSTFINNTFIDSLGIPFFNNSVSGNIWKYNIFYSKNSLKDAFRSDNSGTLDSNYYLRPTLASNLIRLSGNTYSVGNFSADAHGFSTPSNANTNIAPVLLINPTKTDSTIALDNAKTYVDVKGKLYTKSVTLKPYQSALLFVSTLNRIDGIHINSVR